MTISVLLADDHDVVRLGLKALLESEADLKIVGDASDGIEAVEKAERLHPDVAVLDIMMPRMNGLEATKAIRQRSPDTKVVVLSIYDDDAYVQEALRNGASGYVLKDSSGAELVDAVRAAHLGQRHLSKRLSDRAIEAYIERRRPESQDRFDLLTSREREVFLLVAQGLTSKDISQRLDISHRTVEAHRAHIMTKLGLKSQADLIRLALQKERQTQESA
ncbi:MAG: response regulator transcription factor [Chloroflexi bacterium]|nr:response regulator transcription factor [Chloroflexota bacterium]